MRSVSFPISTKENEKRRAITPKEIKSLCNPEQIFVEKGYGEVLNISDKEYEEAGANVCSKEALLSKDIICDPKIGDADYLNSLDERKIIFGWIHATQNREITNTIINKKLTAYAWEKMFDNGRHVFWFNNELAGEAAVLHAFQCFGQLPLGLEVAVIGRGNTARGAIRALNSLGANVSIYYRNQEQQLRNELNKYDVLVNCVLWDIRRKDHIIYREDLARMKKNSLIIDVSCDKNGGIESSVPTTIQDPTYIVDGVMHYVVDHTPAIYYKTFSFNNSSIIKKYVELLMNGKDDETLKDSLIAKDGVIIDHDIIDFQSLAL